MRKKTFGVKATRGIGKGQWTDQMVKKAVPGGSLMPLDREKQKKKANKAAPGGSARPATDYSKSGARGDGSGKAIKGTEKHLTYETSPDSDNPSVVDYQNGMLLKGDAEDEGVGTSIFDPVLCELSYLWFTGQGMSVLDPFAGGSVRGIVAERLGRAYTGIDLRPEQVKANMEQAAKICSTIPEWIVGDSRYIKKLCGRRQFDFVFSCPPYGDLEIYSDDPRDLSNISWEAFLVAYRDIIRASCELLKDDRFACFIVGDFRDDNGFYRNFVSETIDAFLCSGMELYNEAILVTAVGSLPIRAGRPFSIARKLGKTHQNVLVFCKGDPRAAAAACGPVEIPPMEELMPKEEAAPETDGVEEL